MTVILRCGHRVETDGAERPVCRLCGETQVARVQAPAPRITFNGINLVGRRPAPETSHG